ncbi:uncharacterized protein METZ01_LOCUS394151 [marine metagenome]|uniref:SnoaL-like domain-containing protein n=1 Tax=marine metagenome TaxID=408172 RepID=A0A382V4D0_9ZZZZ
MDIFYDENVFFKDPFNEVEGIDNLRNVFVHMFKTLDNPHFVIIDTIENSEGAFLTWDFIFILKGKESKIHGSSHLKFNEDKRIVCHRDYWDVGQEILSKIRYIKFLYGLFIKKLAAS